MYDTTTSPYEYHMNDGGHYEVEKDLGVRITSKPNFTLNCDKAFAKAD